MSTATAEPAPLPSGEVTRTSTPASSSRDKHGDHHHHHHHHHKHRVPTELPPDPIDLMDDSVPPSLLRHHSGPFDPVTRSHYLSNSRSPLAALEHSNAEALKATPESSIRDAVNQHVPLQNTAVVAPGEHVPFTGEVLDYKEENLIGDIGRWDGVEYDDNDRRAKGHPGWEGAFIGLGHNPAEREEIEARKAQKKHKPTKWVQGTTGPEYAGGEDGSMIEMVTPERDLRVDGMPASASAVEEAEKNKHLGVLDGIKRRLSARRHHDKQPQEHQS